MEMATELFWLPTLLGIAWSWAAIHYTPSFMLYLFPVLLGWVL